jgi:hypothetical protein
LVFSFTILFNLSSSIKVYNKFSLLQNATAKPDAAAKPAAAPKPDAAAKPDAKAKPAAAAKPAPAAAPAGANACAAGANGTNGNGTHGGARTGTNVFTKSKTNATDAAGLVGTFNYTLPHPPYIVERCDQVLQIKGKKMDLNDYCNNKTDAFMTMSIYTVNLFSAQNPDKLLMSLHFEELLMMPTILAGTPTCLNFSGKRQRFGFCLDTKELAEEVVEAARKLLECKKSGGLTLIDMLLESCDLSKIDMTENGPFGKDGPKYLEKVLEKKKLMDPGYGKVNKTALIYDRKNLNNYYSLIKPPGTPILPKVVHELSVFPVDDQGKIDNLQK